MAKEGSLAQDVGRAWPSFPNAVTLASAGTSGRKQYLPLSSCPWATTWDAGHLGVPICSLFTSSLTAPLTPHSFTCKMLPCPPRLQGLHPGLSQRRREQPCRVALAGQRIKQAGRDPRANPAPGVFTKKPGQGTMKGEGQHKTGQGGGLVKLVTLQRSSRTKEEIRVPLGTQNLQAEKGPSTLPHPGTEIGGGGACEPVERIHGPGA